MKISDDKRFGTLGLMFPSENGICFVEISGRETQSFRGSSSSIRGSFLERIQNIENDYNSSHSSN